MFIKTSCPLYINKVQKFPEFIRDPTNFIFYIQEYSDFASKHGHGLLDTSR